MNICEKCGEIPGEFGRNSVKCGEIFSFSRHSLLTKISYKNLPQSACLTPIHPKTLTRGNRSFAITKFSEFVLGTVYYDQIMLSDLFCQMIHLRVDLSQMTLFFNQITHSVQFHYIFISGLCALNK